VFGSQVSYSIIIDSVFCLSRALFVQCFVGPGLVCDGCKKPHLVGIYMITIQGVPGGMDKTSGECSLC